MQGVLLTNTSPFSIRACASLRGRPKIRAATLSSLGDATRTGPPFFLDCRVLQVAEVLACQRKLLAARFGEVHEDELRHILKHDDVCAFLVHENVTDHRTVNLQAHQRTEVIAVRERVSLRLRARSSASGADSFALSASM